MYTKIVFAQLSRPKIQHLNLFSKMGLPRYSCVNSSLCLTVHWTNEKCNGYRLQWELPLKSKALTIPPAKHLPLTELHY